MKIRAFLALDVPEEVRINLADMMELLSQKAPGVTWVKPEQVHCTMKFFGEVEEELLGKQIPEVIERALKKFPQVHLQAVGVGVFPNWRYPKVIWAGIQGETSRLLKLHQALEQVFEPYSIPPDHRTFRLHLTLGRAKAELKDPRPLVGFIEKQVGHDFGTFTVDRLTLYKSVLTAKSPIYTPLKQFCLREGGDVDESYV